MSRRLVLVLGILGATSVVPATAFAQSSAERARNAPPKPVVKVEVGGLSDGRVLILNHVTIRGTMAPFRPRQHVVLEFFRDGVKSDSRRVRVTRGPGNFGVFRARFYVEDDVKFAVRAVHRANRVLGRDATRNKSWRVSFPTPDPYSCGKYTKLFKDSLRRLGYVPGGGDCWKSRTDRAVLAFRKVNNMTRNYHAGKRMFHDAFNGIGGYDVKHTSYGHHGEVDLSAQVLVLAIGDRAVKIYPASSGTSATPTVKGHFTISGYRNPGYNSHGMLWSVYFYGGYAVHGYASVPTYPASHGCVRIPIPDAYSVYKWINDGDHFFVNN